MSLSKTEAASYLATAAATVALVLFVGNAWMVNSTQNLQRQLNERQVQINSGTQISNLNGQLVRALGTAVVAQKDEQIKKLLTDHGITVQLEKPTTPAAKPAARRPAAATPETPDAQ